MLKSLLFSLFLMLCLVYDSPLTQAAEAVRPEKPASAESRTSTEDDRYKALLQRLDSIESNLKAKQHIDDALKKFDAQTQGQVSMLSTGFGALSFWATFLALAGVGITYITSRTYTQSIRRHEAELKNIVEEARKHRKTLREIVAERSPSEKFTSHILQQAREAAAQGVGTEVLWGKAILAQQERRWLEALTYWQGVLETFPQDKTALFGASLAAAQLAEKTTGEERQRLWQTAEKHFKAYPKAQLTAAVLYNWGLLCQNRGEAAIDSNERERWFNKAEEKYRKATKTDPDHASSWYNWGLLYQKRGEAATDSNEREHWFNEATEKYRRATEAAPNHANSWGNWGMLCQNRGEAAIDSNERERWFNEATEKYRRGTEAAPDHANNWSNWGLLCQQRGEAAIDSNERERWFNEAAEKYRKGTKADPNHADIWGNWGTLCAQRGDVATDNRVRADWYNEAEEKFRKATKAAPNHANNWYNSAILCMSQGKATNDADAREHYYAEAERKFARALNITPYDADFWFNKACLASLRQDVKACLDALAQWRKYAPDASTAKLDSDSDFDNVRHTPEFQEFCKKLADKK